MINFFILKNQKLTLEKTSILIVGDSHPQKSLNPDYFYDASNISQSGEPYILTFWKLKEIFKTFIPDTLIIGFSPHNISEFNDLKFSDSKWTNNMFERSYSIMNFSQISKIVPVDKKRLYKKVWKNMALFPNTNHINYIGKYSNIIDSDLSNLKTVINRHYYYNNKELNISKICINYLDSIISICETQKIIVVLSGSPVHENYFTKIPKEFIKSYESLAIKYSEEHCVFNSTSNFYSDSLFLDYDHLNEIGAKKFTLEMMNFLDKKQ